MIEVNKIYNEDCRETMKCMDDNSIDSIVTDPPYELGFMGKHWDSSGIAYDVDMWKECLRVLKPGGYLLAFGGTRTSHRMVCAIEDAGFEIRDSILWLYGCLSEDTEILTINGWEHYHKNILLYPVLCYLCDEDKFEFHKPTKDYFYENKHTAYRIQSDNTDQIVSRNHRVIVERSGRKEFTFAEALQQQEDVPFLESLQDLPETIYDFQSHTSIKKSYLLKRVSKQDSFESKEIRNKSFNYHILFGLWEKISNKEEQTRKILLETMLWKIKKLVKRIFRQWEGQIKTRYWLNRRKESSMERWCNLFQEAWKLFTHKIYQVSERISANGSQRRLCYGASVDNGAISWQMPFEDRDSTSYRPQSDKQRFGESNVIQDKPRTQNIRRTTATVAPIKYKGNMWCVEVPTGAFVARRNGKIFITGNSGFPKSMNIGKEIDKLQGNKREVVGVVKGMGKQNPEWNGVAQGRKENSFKPEYEKSEGNSEYEGWGTALKPAHEIIAVAQKPLTDIQYWHSICMSLYVLKLKLWLLSNVNVVAKTFKLSQKELDEVLSIVQWTAEEAINILVGLLDQTDMSQYESEMNINLNTVSLWHKYSEGNYCRMKTSTTRTPIDQIIDPKTLNYCLSQITLNYIIKEKICQKELSANVHPVVKYLLDSMELLKNIQMLSVHGNAISEDLQNFQEEDEKPHHNHICVARKPISEKTVAQNVLKHGTGGINIDGCRIETNPEVDDMLRKVVRKERVTETWKEGSGFNNENNHLTGVPENGRFPANIILDPFTANELDKQAPDAGAFAKVKSGHNGKSSGIYGDYATRGDDGDTFYDDKGGASRFFYIAKADKGERNEGLTQFEKVRHADRNIEDGVGGENPRNRTNNNNKNNFHPTVKPVKLVQYLQRLVTPKGGITYDPFGGSGTSALSAQNEGFRWILSEKIAEYCDIANKRVYNNGGLFL